MLKRKEDGGVDPKASPIMFCKSITAMPEVQEGIRFPAVLDHDDERGDTQDKQVCGATNAESMITQGLEANSGPVFRNFPPHNDCFPLGVLHGFGLQMRHDIFALVCKSTASP